MARNVLELLLGPAQARLQPIWFSFGLPADDPDDQKFVDAYVAAQADYLVTDDRHFRTVLAARFPQVRVVSAAEFGAVLAV